MKLTNLMRYAFTVAIVACFAAAPEIQAQMKAQIQIAGRASLGENTDQSYSAEAMQALLGLHISEMNDTVDLADKQVDKLNLAAKVVARKVFDGRKKRFFVPQGNPQAQSGGDESFSDQDDESQANEPKKTLTEIMDPIALSVALENKTWKSAVKSILTEEQQTQLRDHRDARSKKLREVAVEYRTWELVKRLRLRNDQVEPVSQVVDRIEGADLVKNFGKNLGAAVIIMPQAAKPKKVTPEDLRGILSETQMEEFKSGGKRKSGNLQMQLRGNKAENKTLEARGAKLDSKADRLTVQKVMPESELEKMGVKVGDIVDEVNSKPVDTLVQINRILQAKDKFALTVLRDGKSIQLESKE